MATASFFEGMLENVNNILSNFVTSFSTAIISEISSIVYSGLVLYFIFLGLSYVRGMTDEPIIDLAWHMFKVACIVSIAMNVGTYQSLIVNTLLTLPDSLVTSIMSKAINHTQTGTGLASLLDNTFFKGMDVANQYFENGKFGLTDMDLMPFLNGVLVVAGTVFCIIVACFWLFATKIIMSLLLGVGSVFIIALVWNPTKHYFSSWMNTIVSLILMNLFIMGTFAIFITIFDSYLNAMTPNATDSNHLADSAVIAVMGLITCGVLLLIPMFVSQLTGGSMAVGQAFSAVSNITSGAKNSASNIGSNIGKGVDSSSNAIKNGANKFAEAGGKGYGGYQAYKEARASGMNRGDSYNTARERVSDFYKT